MELTEKMLKDWNACSDGFAWWISHELETVESTIECLIGEEKLEKGLDMIHEQFELSKIEKVI